MPTFIPTTPILKLSSSVACNSTCLPTEREVDRKVLLEIAPDREALLAKTNAIHDIRKALKIRSGSSHGSWLYQTHRSVDIKPIDSTVRASTFFLRATNATHGGKQPHTDAQCHMLRPALSASVIDVYPPTSAALENRLLESARTWSSMNLSTSDVLISPRPLGATHILVVYPPHEQSKTYLELPINDLLFVLNVPNLVNPDLLPHRLPFELPLVRMQVSHLETFPELMVYLHTKNQAELFRKVIPEWIRDVMHPLPPTAVELPVAKTRVGIQKRRRLFSWNPSPVASTTDSVTRTQCTLPALTIPKRTMDSIAKEIAETDIGMNRPSGTESNPLVFASTMLNALRDNLEDVGFYDQHVWSELDISVEILKRALIWKAKTAGNGGKGRD